MKLILSLLTLFIFVSCTSNDTSDFELNQNLYENNKLEDFELFENANKFISQGEYDLALIELDKLEVLFPSSPYSNKGMLLNAYINFLKKDYEKTRALAENYKKYYPGSKDIVYANYLEAMTYYVLIKKPDYSQKDAYNALDKFNFILNYFVNSYYKMSDKDYSEPSPEPEPEPAPEKKKREVKKLTDKQKLDLKKHMDKVGKNMSATERKSHRMKMMAKLRQDKSIKVAHKEITA